MSTTTTTTAADIAAAFRRYSRRDHRHEPTAGQLHRLLFLAQGHYLVWCGKPLFDDRIVVTDVGVLVPALRGHELDSDPDNVGLTNGEANAVGYVLSRYGNLSLHDLDLITRHSQPAVEAGRGRIATTAATIRHDAMTDYFRTVVDTDPDRPMMDAEWMAGFLERSQARAAKRRGREPQYDDVDKIREWAAGLPEQAEPEAAAQSA